MRPSSVEYSLESPHHAVSSPKLNARRKLKRILVHVPKDFLEEFDEETSCLYSSRNEAVRADMILVLEAIRKRHNARY